MDLKILGANLKLLREEARLSIDELSEKTNIDKARISELENGLDEPYQSELDALLPILKINEEDFFDRDLVSERKEAYSQMKKSNLRGDYNWYYGDKKQALFYIISLVVITIVGIISIAISSGTIKSLNELLLEITDPEEIEFIRQSILTTRLISLIPIGIASGVFIVIELFRRFNLHFQWWYIFILTSFSWLLVIISCVLAIPYYIYCIYRGIILHGKNR